MNLFRISLKFMVVIFAVFRVIIKNNVVEGR